MVSRNALDALSKRSTQLLEQGTLSTEEATKHALVLPFIQALGYDIFNPTEVVPEYTADFGLKQGEKVDYAIFREESNGEPAMLIECKRVSDPLDVSKASQLGRYFSQTPTHIGILTNGIVYKFFSDIDAENVMDATPFLVIDITKLDARDISAIDHFAKQSFDIDEARSAASNMKHIRGMKVYLAQMYGQPDSDFVRLLARKVYTGVITQSRFEHFEGLVRLAFQGFINDRINSTLQRASDIANTENDENELPSSPESEPEVIEQVEPSEGRKSITTTVEEVQGYELVKTIVANIVDPSRITIRDTQSYCGVLLDDNNRKTICRLRFNAASVKYLALLDDDRHETRYRLDSIDDISRYAVEIEATVRRHLDN